MPEELSKGRPYTGSKYRYADFLDKTIRPNSYAVLNLKNGTTGQNGRKAWIDDLHSHFDGIAYQLMFRVSQAVYGKTAFRRSGNRLLPNFITLEGDGTRVRHHLNILVRKPDWLAFDDLRRCFQWELMRSRWFVYGEHSFWMEPRTAGASSYSFKDGIEKLLPRSLTGWSTTQAAERICKRS